MLIVLLRFWEHFLLYAGAYRKIKTIKIDEPKGFSMREKGLVYYAGQNTCGKNSSSKGTSEGTAS